MSKFIYQSPGRYVQGKGIVSSIAEETERLGSHALIIADEVVWNITEEKIKERHRHRYEFNNDYRGKIRSSGVVFSGINEDKDLKDSESESKDSQNLENEG